MGAGHENATTMSDRLRALCTRSLLTFSCPRLEREYQQYQGSAVRVFSWTVPLMMAALDAAVYVMLRRKGTAHRHMVPPQAMPLLLFRLPLLLYRLPGLVLMAAAFFPSFHARHHQALHALFHVSSCFSYHQDRQNALYFGLPEAKPAATVLQQATNFTKENMYLFAAWLAFAQLPTGQSLGRAAVLGQLLAHLAGNSAICTSPLWPRHPATTSSTLLGAARAVSAGFLELALPFYHVRNKWIVSCPMTLAVWEVLGSLLAMLTIAAAECLRRRAFLRLPEVQVRLGSGTAAQALHWPWGGMLLPGRIVTSALAVIVFHAVLWALHIDNILYR